MNLYHPDNPNKIITVKEHSSKAHRLINDGYLQTRKHARHTLKHVTLERESLIQSTQLTLTYLNVSIKELHLSPEQHDLMQAAARCLSNHIKRLQPTGD